jgi:hypothetical protein
MRGPKADLVILDELAAHDYRCTPGSCYEDCPQRSHSYVTTSGGWSSPNANPMADIRAAMDKLREWTPPPLVISPQARDAVNQLLERPADTAVSQADMNQAINVAFTRATPEERERFLMIANSYQLGDW